MFYYPRQATVYQKKIRSNEDSKVKYVTFEGFPLGENTSVPAFQLALTELAECVDLKYNPGGQLETREAVIVHTTTAIGAIRDVKSCSIAGTQRIICTDATKVYYLVTNAGAGTIVPTEIGTLGAPSVIVPYNDVAVICDGSYLKYCDGVASIKMAYDAGTGGTFYDNYNGVDNGVESVSANGVGCVFTTPAWTAGYTIPPTKVTFKAIATGAVTLSIDIVRVSDSVVMATKTYLANDIASSAAGFYSATFDTVTAELAPNTAYYALLKGANVDLSYTTIAAAAGKMITNGSTADTAKSPIMRVHPGVPPKADWAIVSGTRLWVHDPEEPGRLYFGNLTHLDFSTTDGGGWIGAVDEDANSFKIGAAADLYGELYVYGTEDQPYICKKTGSIPSEFELPLQFQRSWSTSRTLINTTNDIWSGSASGVDPLTGVEAYGDLRSYSTSDSIQDRFDNWDSTTAFAGYNARDGQYWLYMPSYDYVSVCHTKLPVENENGRVVYPWSRYDLPITPSCFSQVGDTFMIGSTNGYIYKLDTDSYKDLDTTQIAPYFRSAYVETPFKTVDLISAQAMASSRFGSNLTVDIYKNGSRVTSSYTLTVPMPISDAVTLAEVEDVLLSDLYEVALTPVGAILYFPLNINCYSFQVRVSDIFIAGAPVYINGMVFKYRQLEA